MTNDKVTLMIVVISISALFGALFGGISAFVLSQQIGLVEGVADQFGVELKTTGEQDSDQIEDHIIKMIEEETATISVVEKVTPAVVSVIAKREYSGELVEVGGGTGFFVSSEGLVLTNRHVINSGGVTYSILTNNGDEYPIEIVAKDTLYDLAVLQVVLEEGQEADFPIVELGDSDSIKNGQTVIAIGNALSEYQNSVTKGVISGTGRRVVAGNYYSTEVIEGAIQTDAAINPGNSGGPLINLLGQVIGVNTATSSAGEGLGFAIPINLAVKIVDDMVEFGHIVRPWLGVRYIMIDQNIAQENNLDSDYGALIISGQGSEDYAIVPGSPADQAGLQESDIIISLNDIVINEENSLSKQINTYAPGDLINVTVVRQGEQITLHVELAEMDSTYLE
ncbi:MAG: trypsin-like peptidase domain-containing protein [Candidatus Uhrbacteria bacterium]